MPMSKNLVYIGIAVLIVVALILGYKIYEQQTGYKLGSLRGKSDSVTVKPNRSPSSTESSSTTSKSDKEKSVLNFPADNASPEQMNKFFDEVGRLGVESNTLQIAKCQPSPLVIRVKKGASFNITNSDSVERELIVDPTHKYKVSAGGLVSFKADFGTGILGYRCSGVGFETQPLVGVINVLE